MADIKLELRKRAKSLEPVVRIGKSGLTESQLGEIERFLKNKELIKIKMLGSAAKDKDVLIKRVLENTCSELIEKVGNVFVIYKKKEYKK